MDQTEESNPPPEEASPEGAPDEGENDSSEVQNENETSIPPATTMKTTTMKTFVPTVAGERGIFAPWPKKVTHHGLKKGCWVFLLFYIAKYSYDQ